MRGKMLGNSSADKQMSRGQNSQLLIAKQAGKVLIENRRTIHHHRMILSNQTLLRERLAPTSL